MKRASKHVLNSLQGHIIGLLQSSMEVIAKDIPHSDCVFTREDSVIVFFHNKGKQTFVPGVKDLVIIMYCTSLFPVWGKEDASTKDKASVMMDHFCKHMLFNVWTNTIRHVNIEYSTPFIIGINFEISWFVWDLSQCFLAQQRP